MLECLLKHTADFAWSIFLRILGASIDCFVLRIRNWAQTDCVSNKIRSILLGFAPSLSESGTFGSSSGMRKNYRSPSDAIGAETVQVQLKKKTLHPLRPSRYLVGSLNKPGRIAGRKTQRHPTLDAARCGIHWMRPAAMMGDNEWRRLWFASCVCAADGWAAENQSLQKQWHR